MQIIVYGAGAVGSVLGGMLSLHHHDVMLIGRQPLVDAIARDGLRIKSATGEYVAHPRASARLSIADLAPDASVFLTTKSYDVPAARDALAATIPNETPVVCFQNGVVSEDAVAERFASVYGAVVNMTCSMVQPGHVSYRAPGRVIVGRHPKGIDPRSRVFADAFGEAGFDAAASRAIGSDKWLKLAVNVQSVLNAAVDPRDHDANEFFELKVAILEEVKRVFKAAKIRARSCDGHDPSIDEMIAELKRPRARRSDHGVKLHNSTWQDLYLKRPHIEAEYFHGPVIAMGREHGIPTPLNAAMLQVAARCHESKSGPESLRLSDVIAVVAKHRAS
jgi:2-dehydropantoate 2-reductase